MMDLGGYRQALQIWAEQRFGEHCVVVSHSGEDTLVLKVSSECPYWDAAQLTEAYRFARWEMPCQVELQAVSTRVIPPHA